MEHSQFCEHSVKQKTEGKLIVKRALLVALYVFIPLLFTFIGLAQKNFLPYLAVALLIDLPTVLVTWRRTRIEYEYSMTGGLLVFSIVYGGSARKTVFEQDLRSIAAAFPYGSEEGRKRLGEYAPEVQHFALATQSEEENAEKEIWCCLFESDEGKRTAFYFELTDTAYRFLRLYANAATAPRRVGPKA